MVAIQDDAVLTATFYTPIHAATQSPLGPSTARMTRPLLPPTDFESRPPAPRCVKNRRPQARW
jgi:hypothetical protein